MKQLQLISLVYQPWYNVFSHNKTTSAGLSATETISRTACKFEKGKKRIERNVSLAL
jgi:hypothetical protein